MSEVEKILSRLETLSAKRWKLVTALFICGLCMHLPIFFMEHNEGDEVIYKTLVGQLDSGKGYTLQGSFLLTERLLDDNYDRILFFHPPGGIFLYWLSYKVFGTIGFCIVQLLSYALFFWSMLILSESLGLTSSNFCLLLIASLSAFSPIMSHVTMKYWLDGPLLAFATSAAAMYVRGVSREKFFWVALAGLLLGYASLIKVTAFLIAPGLLCMGWYLSRNQLRPFLRLNLLFIITAITLQLPWGIWQWVTLGSPFPTWPGKPSRELIENNRYVAYLTVIRGPWVYLKLTGMIMMTSISSLLLGFAIWRRNDARNGLRFSMLIWASTILAFHVAMGYMGYSKVLRYVILITPALIILFASLFYDAYGSIKQSANQPTMGLIVILGLSLASYAIEILTGIVHLLHPYNDLITPLIGGTLMMQ